MKPTPQQAQTLQQFRSILLQADAPHLPSSSVPDPDGSNHHPVPSSQAVETRRCISRLFYLGEAVECASMDSLFPPQVIATLEQLGILARNCTSFTAGEYRLVSHLGLFLFCHRVSAHARFYYGTDSLALSRVLTPVSGRVLDLCAGVGAQSLVCAQTASSVTAVEIEPAAEPVFWINTALNGLTDKVEFLSGDLFEPLAGRQFDRICSNPPFLPVPPEIRFPLYAGGGPDGLSIVRRLLEGLPDFLAPAGECHIIGSALGSLRGPNLSSLEDLAVAANLRIEVSCYSYEELDEPTLALFAATALHTAGSGDPKQEYRDHFRRLGATHLYYFVLRARHHAGCITPAAA
jgi:methylase of polypeptide subunit release factors